MEQAPEEANVEVKGGGAPLFCWKGHEAVEGARTGLLRCDVSGCAPWNGSSRSGDVVIHLELGCRWQVARLAAAAVVVWVLCCCFFVATFTLFAPFQPGLNIFMSFFRVFLSFSRFMFLVSLPCTSCTPPLFCVCSRGMEHMTLGTLAGTYSMCIVSGPFQEGTIRKRSYLSEFILRSFPLIVSCFAVFIFWLA